MSNWNTVEQLKKQYPIRAGRCSSVEDINRAFAFKKPSTKEEYAFWFKLAAEMGGIYDRKLDKFRSHFEYNPENGALLPATIQSDGFISERNIVRRKGMRYMSGWWRTSVISEIIQNKSTNQIFKKGVMGLRILRPISFFDAETTGVDASSDRIVELAICKLNPDHSRETKTWLINPERPIPEGASKVHGITDDKVKDCPTFIQLALEVEAYLAGCDIAGFNSNVFDVPLLFNEFERAGIYWDYTQFNMIDVRNIYVRKEERTLSAAVKFYTGVDLENAHSAEADIEATVDVFEEQLRKYEDLPIEVDQLALYSNFDKKIVDLSGKFSLDQDGNIIFNFGKNLNKRAKSEPDYLRWMLGGSFAKDTKNVIRQLLAS